MLLCCSILLNSILSIDFAWDSLRLEMYLKIGVGCIVTGLAIMLVNPAPEQGMWLARKRGVLLLISKACQLYTGRVLVVEDLL